jgi:hypothetical protein
MLKEVLLLPPLAAVAVAILSTTWLVIIASTPILDPAFRPGPEVELLHSETTTRRLVTIDLHGKRAI